MDIENDIKRDLQKLSIKSGVLGVRIKVLDEDDTRMRFVIGGVDSSFANALRRTVMGEVEIMAIDMLEIHDASTMMNDDQLFSRLGLLPLRCCGKVLDSFLKRRECDCDDGCLKCTAKFTLNVVNRSDEVVEVTSHDLVCHNPNVTLTSDKIHLVKLGKNQELSFTAFAVKSSARYENNAKWNPVSVAAYRPTAKINVSTALVNQYLTPEQQRIICLAEPAQVIAYDEVKKCIVPHPDAPLRCTYSGDFIEALGNILHPPPPTKSTGADDKENDNKDLSQDQVLEKEKRLDKKQSEDKRLAPVHALEEASAKLLRHPTDLVHPLISMVPSTDEFLFPVISTGCMRPREIVLRALTTLRRRLTAIQMLNRRQNFFTITK